MCRRSLLPVFLVFLLSLNAAVGKLKVDLYAESLCPYCRKFVVQDIWSLFQNGLADAMDFHVHYAGNTRLVNGKLVCQHGESECYLNRVVNCGISKSKDAHQWLKFLVCIEDGANKARYDPSVVKACSTLSKLDGDKVLGCANGQEGIDLHMAEHMKTQALTPRKKWVPWLVVDGMPMYDLTHYLYKLLCVQTAVYARPKKCYEEDKEVENLVDLSNFRTYPDAELPTA